MRVSYIKDKNQGNYTGGTEKSLSIYKDKKRCEISGVPNIFLYALV
jgi:hypothetical protein